MGLLPLFLSSFSVNQKGHDLDKRSRIRSRFSDFGKFVTVCPNRDLSGLQCFFKHNKSMVIARVGEVLYAHILSSDTRD